MKSGDPDEAIDVAIALARQREREREESHQRALEDANFASLLAAMASPAVWTTAIWVGEQRDLYAATTLVRDEDMRIARPDEARTIYNEPAYAQEDRQWTDLRESIAGMPASRFGPQAQAWAARVAPTLVFNGLWVPFARLLRSRPDVELWRARLQDPRVTAHLRQRFHSSPRIGPEALVAVGAHLLGVLLDDLWSGELPSKKARTACISALERLRRDLREAFAALGSYPSTVARVVVDDAAESARRSPAQTRSSARRERAAKCGPLFDGGRRPDRRELLAVEPLLRSVPWADLGTRPVRMAAVALDLISASGNTKKTADGLARSIADARGAESAAVKQFILRACGGTRRASDLHPGFRALVLSLGWPESRPRSQL